MEQTLRHNKVLRPSARNIQSVLISALLLCIQANAQVLAPNLSSCHFPVGLPSEETPFLCCAPLPPAGMPPPELFIPNIAAELRVRRPAHKLDDAEVARLARAYELMKALPDDDPRSFMQQANIHCAYCNTAYNQRNSTQLFQVHQSWLFFPFHRWYLFFHERILAKLLQDDTFALPYWNYDHPEGSTIPWMYANVSVLVDSKRNGEHLPPAVAQIDYNYNSESRSAEDIIKENANHIYRVLIRDADTQTKFFGMPYRHGDSPMPGAGTVEMAPHNTVHIWVGSPHEVGGKDLGSFYAAARDPVFYAHHAELDRMWELWKQLSSDNIDIFDTEFLDSELEFYDENAELVRVRIGDSLDTRKLGYVYEDVELPWLDAVPVRLSHGPASLSSDDTICEIGTGKPITEPCSVVVKRSEGAIAVAAGVDERLVLYDMKFTEGLPMKTDIYLNLPSANVNTTAGCHEYVGQVSSVPQFSEGVDTISSGKFNITSRVLDLNLSGEGSLVFTFVPRGLDIGSPASIFDVVLEYPTSNFSTKSSSSPEKELKLERLGHGQEDVKQL